MSLTRADSQTVGELTVDLSKAAKDRNEMPDLPAKSKKADVKKVARDKNSGDSELIIPPRSQVRVSAYSMSKIRAIMEIKDIQFSHEVINYILSVAEESIFTDIEKKLYDAQMEFQRLKFEENGWDTES